jgi:hypothetical protein
MTAPAMAVCGWYGDDLWPVACPRFLYGVDGPCIGLVGLGIGPEPCTMHLLCSIHISILAYSATIAVKPEMTTDQPDPGSPGGDARRSYDAIAHNTPASSLHLFFTLTPTPVAMSSTDPGAPTAHRSIPTDELAPPDLERILKKRRKWYHPILHPRLPDLPRAVQLPLTCLTICLSAVQANGVYVWPTYGPVVMRKLELSGTEGQTIVVGYVCLRLGAGEEGVLCVVDDVLCLGEEMGTRGRDRWGPKPWH